MRTVVAAVLVGCASAAAHADVLDMNQNNAVHLLGAGVTAIEAYPIVEPLVPEHQPAYAATVTPGSVALAMLALGGVAIGKLSEQRFGVSTGGSVD